LRGIEFHIWFDIVWLRILEGIGSLNIMIWYCDC